MDVVVGNDDSSDDDDNEDFFQLENDQKDEVVLRSDYESIFKKVRTICKLFRKSPVKNDQNLQEKTQK